MFDLAMFMKIIALVPTIVAGIEKIHGESQSGATKKAMAMDALAVATGVASTAAPSQDPAIAAAGNLASNLIDNTVSVFNAAGAFSGSGASTAATPATAGKPAPVTSTQIPAAHQ